MLCRHSNSPSRPTSLSLNPAILMLTELLSSLPLIITWLEGFLQEVLAMHKARRRERSKLLAIPAHMNSCSYPYIEYFMLCQRSWLSLENMSNCTNVSLLSDSARSIDIAELFLIRSSWSWLTGLKLSRTSPSDTAKSTSRSAFHKNFVKLILSILMRSEVRLQSALRLMIA